MSDYVLEMRGITKSFPGVRALDGVDFGLKSGETHVIMGENGAGKSTFIKIITGVHTSDNGEIYLYGKKVNIRNPKDSLDLGIAAIYQHSTGYPHLSVTENIFLGHEKISKRTKTIQWNRMHNEAEEYLKSLGADIDPRVQLGALSVAQQQIVEIAKALSTNAKIIIMDEPTAALTRRESEQLYKIVDQLKEKGTSVIFISHRFEDMFRVADRVTVLRDGKYIGTWNRDEINANDIIVAMVGREISQIFPPKKAVIGEELFRVENLSKTGYFKDISFSVHRGEIVGLTGLVGAGRSEVCQALFGIISYDSGAVYLEGKEIKVTSPLQAMELGIGYLPEDRQQQGLILNWEIVKNITLPTLEQYSNRGWINPEREAKAAEEYSKKLNVKANSVYTPVSSLSGGNQQKVIIAKLLSAELKVIILDEPTKGVDVGAKVAIYEIINSLAEQGYGIILVSSEMPEILGMCDKIVVMREGRITAVFDGKEATSEKILEASMSTKKE